MFQPSHLQMNPQLALAIQPNDEATLADFCWGSNALVRLQLEKALLREGETLLYLWGACGSGKSHLLQGCCQAANNHHYTAIYLPLNVLKEWGPHVIEGVEDQDFICVDDIEVIAKDSIWEEAFFHLYNRIRDNGKTTLIMAGNKPPASLSIQLPDLRSRLSWGLVMHLLELTDEEKIKTLKDRAHRRGFELPTAVGQLLLNRCARNMHDLQELLNRLDEASLRAKRKITVPFVREILGL